MRVTIIDDRILPPGEYEMTDPSKLARAKAKIGSGSTEGDLLLEYDGMGGRLLRDDQLLPPQTLWNLEKRSMNKPIEDFSDDELLAIIRRAENTNIPGSLYQRAKNEQEIRHQRKMIEVAQTAGETSLIAPAVVIHGDFVAQNKIGRDQNNALPNSSIVPWWKRPEIVIGIASLIIAVISIQWWSSWYRQWIQPYFQSMPVVEHTLIQELDLATSTLTVRILLDKHFSLTTYKQQTDFLEKYRNTNVQDKGEYTNMDEKYDTHYIFLNVDRYPVVCSLQNVPEELSQRIDLLTKGDVLSFSGVFTGYGHGFGGNNPWLVRDCVFK